jgi:hypothetical protein
MKTTYDDQTWKSLTMEECNRLASERAWSPAELDDIEIFVTPQLRKDFPDPHAAGREIFRTLTYFVCSNVPGW